MPRNVTVIFDLDDQPGELARLGEATGQAGVNIRGLAAFTADSKAIVNILIDTKAVGRCREAIERAGMRIADVREVLVVDIEDQPGSFGELARRLAEANVDIDLAYTVFGGVKVVIATDDLSTARAVLR